MVMQSLLWHWAHFTPTSTSMTRLSGDLWLHILRKCGPWRIEGESYCKFWTFCMHLKKSQGCMTRNRGKLGWGFQVCIHQPSLCLYESKEYSSCVLWIFLSRVEAHFVDSKSFEGYFRNTYAAVYLSDSLGICKFIQPQHAYPWLPYFLFKFGN